MKKIFLFGFGLLINALCINGFDEEIEAEMDTAQLIRYHGYPVEVYDVTTADGYIITIFRIPAKKINAPVVILQPGITSSSSDYIVLRPGHAMGYLASDDGYDVWLSNNRGNTFGRKHVTYSLDSPQFWNFSFHEMGVYDMPAIIDFILLKTGEKQLFYMGHSQGTTQFLVMTSVKPEYNEKIKLAILMAPVAFLSHQKSFLLRLGTLLRMPLKDIFTLLRLHGLFSHYGPSGDFVHMLCKNSDFLIFVCETVMFTLGGYDYQQFDRGLGTSIFGHVPAGTSMKSLLHFAQLISKDETFKQFNYGKDHNLEKYHTTTPPDYPLEKIRVPLFLINGGRDFVSDPKDVDILIPKLKKGVLAKHTFIKSYNHFDFIWGSNAKEMVYEPALQMMKKFRSL